MVYVSGWPGTYGFGALVLVIETSARVSGFFTNIDVPACNGVYNGFAGDNGRYVVDFACSAAWYCPCQGDRRRGTRNEVDAGRVDITAAAWVRQTDPPLA